MLLRTSSAAVCFVLFLMVFGSVAGIQPASATHHTSGSDAGQRAESAKEAEQQALSPVQIALLNRLTWGVTPELAKTLASSGEKAFIEQQLAPSDQPLPQAVQGIIENMTISAETTKLVLKLDRDRKALGRMSVDDPDRKAAVKAWQQRLSLMGTESRQRYFLRALHSPNQLQEKMTWFWLNHFNIYISNSPSLRPLMADFEEQAIRPNALGKFEDLLAATVRHPAMLIYLNNTQNRKGKINENYGRELLELHTLGVDGGYTQDDVMELSRSLTGLGINLTGKPPKLPKNRKQDYVLDGIFQFHPVRHDYGKKRILGHVVQGRGLAEIDEVVGLLATHPSTARHLSRKLAVYFVSDSPSDDLVEAMSRVFLNSGGDIAQTLEVMIQSDEFRASLLQDDFKDPMRYILGATRLMHSGEDKVVNVRPLLNWLARMGESLYGRRTPDGYPLERKAWQNAGQMLTRFEVSRFIGGSAARLYVPDGQGGKPLKRAVPTQARKAYEGVLRNGLTAETRKTLQQAKTRSEWNALLLASPDFMNH